MHKKLSTKEVLKRLRKAGFEFVVFDEILKEELKDPKFKRGYEAELAALGLSHELKILRKKKRLSQKEVADRADMPQSVIARLESGRHSASIATLQRVAQVFGRKITLSK